jgi:hypothetical protein
MVCRDFEAQNICAGMVIVSSRLSIGIRAALNPSCVPAGHESAQNLHGQMAHMLHLMTLNRGTNALLCVHVMRI